MISKAWCGSLEPGKVNYDIEITFNVLLFSAAHRCVKERQLALAGTGTADRACNAVADAGVAWFGCGQGCRVELELAGGMDTFEPWLRRVRDNHLVHLDFEFRLWVVLDSRELLAIGATVEVPEEIAVLVPDLVRSQRHAWLRQ